MRSASLFRCPTVRPRTAELFRAFRNVGFILVVALSLGCGSHDPKTMFGTSFNPPALTMLQPATVPVNSSPFVLTVNGTNFGRDALVFWNNVPHMARFVNSTQLQVSITVDDLTTFGLVPIFVQTAGMTSNTVDFDVTAN